MLALQAAVLVLLGVALAPSEQSAIDAADKHLRGVVPDIVKNRFINNNLRHVVPPPPLGSEHSLKNVQTLWVNQKLDHFDPTDTRTWWQRYYARTDDYRAGGPVLIYVGGEGEVSNGTLADNVLFMKYLAEWSGAKTFALEHRFYGQSHPLPDLTTASLKYLSADQALEDLAFFIQYLKDVEFIEKDQPVALIGGSYPGNLVAWARYKYPHLIKAAISSSAPVLAEADFVEYMQVVGWALVRNAGEWCYDNVKKATDRIAELIQTSAGQQQVRQAFRMDNAFDFASKDIDHLFQVMSNNFANKVQYNKDSRPDSNIQSICSQMSGDLTPDQAMAKMAHLILGNLDRDGVLVDWTYALSIQSLKNTAYTTDANGIFRLDRQWTYQTCSEFGYYQTYTSGNTPFPEGYNTIDLSIQICKDVFGSNFGLDELNASVRRNNLVFGGRLPAVTNVFFVNGNVDPWFALGVTQNLSSSSPAFLVDGGSHCEDMDYPNWTDLPDITTVHEKIRTFLGSVLPN